jgi:hypothetical protein
LILYIFEKYESATLCGLNIMEFGDLNTCSNQIHLSLSLRSNAATLSSSLDFYKTKRLKGVKSVADNTTRSLSVMLGGDRSLLVGATTKHTAHSTYTETLTEVHTAGNGSGADIVPVRVKGGKLLEASGLGEIHISGELDL